MEIMGALAAICRVPAAEGAAPAPAGPCMSPENASAAQGLEVGFMGVADQRGGWYMPATLRANVTESGPFSGFGALKMSQSSAVTSSPEPVSPSADYTTPVLVGDGGTCYRSDGNCLCPCLS